LRDSKLNSLVRNLFRPSYGGNRNFTLMYTLGQRMISSDDDMRPHGLVEDSPESLNEHEICRGKLSKSTQNGHTRKSFRSGTTDADAVDYVDMYLSDEGQIDIEALNNLYVLVNFRPAVTNKNWRIDCGVAGYDNTVGLPPFFPTRLRFEDYIYRLWIQQQGIVAAHVDSVQTHTKSNYMRNPLAAEVFNEEVCNLLKKKIKSSLTKINDLSIGFEYEGEVTLQDTEEILENIRSLHARVLKAAEAAAVEERKRSLNVFAVSLERAFYSFEPDFFQQNVTRMVDDVISQIKSSLELWPTLVEIVFFQKHRKALPQVRVKNKKNSRAAA